MNQERENGKGIIFGVLGILTLIIAIMGASLAYFTASASAADEEIKVTSATVTITYVQGDILTAEELIPSDFDVVKLTYERTGTDDQGNTLQCKDSKGYQVCSVFRFKASNEAGRNNQKITGKITTLTDITALGQEREFENLRFAVFKVQHDENGDPVYDDYGKIVREEIGSETCHGYLKPTTTLELDSLGKPSTQLFNKCTGAEADAFGNNPDYEVDLLAGEIAEFEVVIWLNELSEDLSNDDGSGNQNFEQGLSYTGQIEIGVSGASDVISGEYSE